MDRDELKRKIAELSKSLRIPGVANDDDDEDDDDDDGGDIALVGARLNPKPGPRVSSIALPEPD